MEKITLVNLGRNLKVARKTKGLTQKELAIKTGLFTSNLCNYENSNDFPSLIALVKILNALEVSFEELVK